MASLAELKGKLTTYLFEVKLAADAAKAAQEAQKPDLMEAFAAWAAKGQGTVDIDTPVWKGQATYVKPGETAEVDVKALRELVSPEVWAMISVPAVDPALLQAAVDLKQVPQSVLAQVTNFKPRAGSIRFTGHPLDVEPTEAPEPAAAPIRVVSRPRRAVKS
jgi:hypothetical protein